MTRNEAFIFGLCFYGFFVLSSFDLDLTEIYMSPSSLSICFKGNLEVPSLRRLFTLSLFLICATPALLPIPAPQFSPPKLLTVCSSLHQARRVAPFLPHAIPPPSFTSNKSAFSPHSPYYGKEVSPVHCRGAAKLKISGCH